ncbi:Uma2 family endonuclease [Synechococcus sp. PCC 7336]|uniref:Uma2 family endonuclease n=1 Tax=Synechococcus sp. PCC 7336 TaxID=195250 RepID=UPI0003481F20|nr:Uma2 family endonuclease [Synechococcus sp. PCC 7336]
MVQFKPRQYLPTQDELPETDFAPVDSELQVLAASLLGDLLAWHWRDRTDWFWGINLAVYYDPEKPSIAPDGFLSLGVERLPRKGGRLSYVVWDEGELPILVVEYVSRTYGQEYGSKMEEYARIGVLYYAIYNLEYCTRKRRQPLEVYRLEGDRYVLQTGEPVWLPEIGLGLGSESGTYRGWSRDWLYWYDREGNRLTAPTEVAEQERLLREQESLRVEQERQLREQESLRAEQERQLREQESLRAEQEQQLREQLLDKLRQKGIDPDTL